MTGTQWRWAGAVAVAVTVLLSAGMGYLAVLDDTRPVIAEVRRGESVDLGGVRYLLETLDYGDSVEQTTGRAEVADDGEVFARARVRQTLVDDLPPERVSCVIALSDRDGRVWEEEAGLSANAASRRPDEETTCLPLQDESLVRGVERRIAVYFRVPASVRGELSVRVTDRTVARSVILGR